MLHVFAFIQCDVCNGVLAEIAVAGDPRQTDLENSNAQLEARLHSLRLAAEERGWQATHDSTKHFCADCCQHS